MFSFFNNHRKHLRFVALAEGISFILLCGIAVPLKYIGGYEHATQELGMAHGILFVWYCIAVLNAHFDLKWPIRTTFLALLASVLPLGTFVADAKLFKKL